jgi:hypothetical protein
MRTDIIGLDVIERLGTVVAAKDDHLVVTEDGRMAAARRRAVLLWDFRRPLTSSFASC